MADKAVASVAELRMPKLSDSMDGATIVAWLVKPGETFVRGQGLFEVETDKATLIYEAEADGTLLEILVPEDGRADLGAPVALTDGGAQPISSGKLPQQRPARTNATPIARALAKQMAIDVSSLAGSGPGGRVIRRDVLAVSPGEAHGTFSRPEMPSPMGVESRRIALTASQRVIGARMSESRTTVPDFTLAVDVDVTSALELREQLNEMLPDGRITINDWIVKACAVALREFPRMNASYDADAIIEHGHVNVGVAVAVEDLLLVPVVPDADALSLSALSAELRRLVQRAQERKLTLAEMDQGTFTVSNLGMFGIREFQAVVNPPQAAILAVGGVVRRPMFDERGAVVGRDTVAFSLSCDHRVVNGAEAARFLDCVRALLERPLLLVSDAFTRDEREARGGA